MFRILFLTSFALLMGMHSTFSQTPSSRKLKSMPTPGVHAFQATTNDGKAVNLADYRGKVMLIVNTASACGYTPQYAPLEALYKKYGPKGLAILAFPANNFGAQEPGTDAEIRTFCSTKYGVTFDLFSKISVKGDDIHPLYRYLTTSSGFTGDIAWNFNKFLVDKNGTVVARFDSKADPMGKEITGKIEELLAK